MVAVAGGLLALFRIPRWITVLLGAVVVAIWFLVQVVNSLPDSARSRDFFDTADFGAAVTVAGGFLMLSGR